MDKISVLFLESLFQSDIDDKKMVETAAELLVKDKILATRIVSDDSRADKTVQKTLESLENEGFIKRTTRIVSGESIKVFALTLQGFSWLEEHRWKKEYRRHLRISNYISVAAVCVAIVASVISLIISFT